MVGKDIPLEVVDEKALSGVDAHPSKDFGYALIREMVAEQRIEDDVGLPGDLRRPVIGNDPFRVGDPGAVLARVGDAIRIDVDAGHLQPYSFFPAPAVDHLQVVAAPASDLADMQGTGRPCQPPEGPEGDGMSAQQGIDGLQFLHVPADIFERNVLSVEEFRLV